MEEKKLMSCPKCGFELTAKHRKGNWMHCPACKNFFQITLSAPETLGYCPHRCNHKLTESDYIEPGILKCPQCNRKSISRGEGNRLHLMKYIGSCPVCDNPMGEDDLTGNEKYKCNECGTYVVKRSQEYKVFRMTDSCPICGKPFCAEDWNPNVGGTKCPRCNNTFKIPNGETLIAKENYALTGFYFQTFMETCFDRLMRFAPKDIFEKMQIKESKIMYFPFCRRSEKESQPLFDSKYSSFLNHETLEIDKSCPIPFDKPAFDIKLSTNREPYHLDDNPRCFTADRESLPKDKDTYDIEFIAITKTCNPDAIIEYKPMFYMRYEYNGEDRSFYSWDACSNSNLRDTISATNLPIEKALNKEHWLPKWKKIYGYLIVIGLVYLMWDNSSIGRGILLSLFALFSFVKMATIRDYIGNLMRTQCQEKKKKDLLRIYNYQAPEDYKNLPKYYSGLRQFNFYPIYK